MKLLVATALTQGERQNDYCFAIEGELVLILPPCAADAKDPDGHCGCGRGFAGLVSARATTTAMVTEVADVTVQDYTEALRTGLQDQGYVAGWADEMASGILELISPWPVGAVVERRLGVFRPRALFVENDEVGSEDLPLPQERPHRQPNGRRHRPREAHGSKTVAPVVIPDGDLALIQARSAAREREGDGSSFFVEVQISGRDVTLVECRLWPASGRGQEDRWVRKPAVRLRYLRSRGTWQLFWSSGKDRWHRYDRMPRSEDVTTLLDEIEVDPDRLLGW